MVEKCPVESPELLTDEMMLDFVQEAGGGGSVMEVHQYDLEIQ